MTDETIRAVAFCPHCGNRAPQTLVFQQEFLSTSYTIDGQIFEERFPSTYFVAKCETCNELLLYIDEPGMIPEPRYFPSTYLAWPDSGQLGKAVPEGIRQIYEEAFKIRFVAPNAFAVQIRRGLEAIADERGATGANLHQRLRILVDQGEIPPVLAEMTDLIRLLGNIGAHYDVGAVRPGYVRVIDDFFRAIVEYVYVAPNKLKRLKDSLGNLHQEDASTET